MSFELAALDVPFRAVGREAVLRAFRDMDAAGAASERQLQQTDRATTGLGNATAALARRMEDTRTTSQRMLAGMSAVVKVQEAGSAGARKWAEGLLQLATSKPPTLEKPVDGVAAAMGRAASGTRSWAQGLGVLKGQQDAAAAAADRGAGATARLITGMTAAGAAALEANVGSRSWSAGLAQLKGQEDAAAASARTLRLEANAAGLAARQAGAASAQGGLLSRAGSLLSGGGLLAGGGRSLLAGIAGGLIGGGLIQVALSSIRGVGQELAAATVAADAFESSQRKLLATSKITGVALQTIVDVAATAEDQFKLSSAQAADFTTNIIRLTSQAKLVDRSSQLMAAFLDLARARGLDAASAMQALETTIIGQDEGLNKLGLANPQQIYEKWARAAGTSAAKMSEVQKWQAIVNELITVGTKVQGEYARGLETSAGKAEVAARAHEKFSQELGRTLGPARDVGNALESWALEKMAAGLKTINEELAKLAPPGGLAGSIEQALRQATTRKPTVRPPGVGELVAEAGKPDAANKEIADLTKALALGTATNAERRQAITLIRDLRGVLADETLAVDKRNQAQEQLNDLLAAMDSPLRDKQRAQELTDLAALADAGQLTGQTLKLLQDDETELTAILERGHPTRARRVELLKQQAAAELLLAQLPNPDRPSRNVTFAAPAPPAPAEAPSPFLGPVPGMPGLLPGLLGPQGGAIGAGLSPLRQQFKDEVDKITGQMREDLTQSLVAAITGGLASGFEAIGRGDVGSGFKAMGGAMLSGFGSMLIQFGTASLAASALMAKIRAAMASLNPAAAIAASLAMIALGGLLKGAAAKAFGDGGGSSGGGGSSSVAPQSYTTALTVGAGGLITGRQELDSAGNRLVRRDGGSTVDPNGNGILDPTELQDRGGRSLIDRRAPRPAPVPPPVSVVAPARTAAREAARITPPTPIVYAPVYIGKDDYATQRELYEMLSLGAQRGLRIRTTRG